MTITFHYKKVRRPDGSEIRTPSIYLLMHGEETIETVALVDSGADVSAMPQEFAEALGLDFSGKKAPAFGIGGKVDTVETEVRITVAKGHEKYSFWIPVKVIMGSYDLPILLGRAGFFEHFVISFNEKRQTISLKRLSG
jgi:hypothetical protein